MAKKKQPATLRDLIRIEVEARDLTRKELADRCDGDPSRQSIDFYLNGRNDLGSDRASRLVTALGLRVVLVRCR